MSKTFLKAGLDIDNGSISVSIMQIVGSIDLRDMPEIETILIDIVNNISCEETDDVGIEEFEGYCELVVSISKVRNNASNSLDINSHLESHFVHGAL